MFEKILCANDGSDGAQKAFNTALELAIFLKADLHMVSVEEKLPRCPTDVEEFRGEKERQDEYFEEVVEQCRVRAAYKGKTLQSSVIIGPEVKTIVEFVRKGGFDLLVLGFTGHSKVFDQLWVGTSQNLTRMAPCSVLVVK
jgi:nucleotide-binding universal stress UspA family protein